MDVHALTIEAVRDGPVCTLLLRGDLDLSEASGMPGSEVVTARLRPGAAR
jgi:hypothetical protein